MEAINYLDSIIKTVEYIEENLTDKISLAEVADISGFSKYHFLRIFKAINGETVFDYIRGRKLTKAAVELLETELSIIDIAVMYGYDSQESFSRAFKEVYGITPNRYRKNKVQYTNLNKLMITEKIIAIKERKNDMKPTFVKKGAFTIVGMKYEGKNENGEISKLWNQFFNHCNMIPNRINEDVAYGFETYDERFKEGEFTYIAGVEVANDSDIPEGMVSRKVEANTYAVFEMPAIIENIPKEIGKIFREYLPDNNLIPVGNYDFEFYTNQFKPNDPDSKLYFYVPVRKN